MLYECARQVLTSPPLLRSALATGKCTAVALPPPHGSGAVVALAAGSGFCVSCFEGGVAVFRLRKANRGVGAAADALAPVLEAECGAWLGSGRVVSVHLQGAVAHFITEGGIAMGVSLNQGVAMWRTPPVFAGITNSALVGRRLLAGSNNGIVSLDVKTLRLSGTCVSHKEDAPPSTLDFVLAEYLPQVMFAVGVVVMLMEALQMMRFATSAATPKVSRARAASMSPLRAC